MRMRERETGRSSITMLRSLYYAIKVTLALFVGIFRRRVVPLEDLGGESRDTAHVSIAASVASILLILVVLELIRSRRLRERYALLWLATGVVLLVLSALARRPEHDRRLGRRHRLPAGGALRGRDALHPRRAAPLLDRDLEARRPERDPGAAARAARAARPARARAAELGRFDRLAERRDVAGGGIVAGVGGDADPVADAGRRRPVAPARLARRPEQRPSASGALLRAAVVGALDVRAGQVCAIDAVEDLAAAGRRVRPRQDARLARRARPPRRSSSSTGGRGCCPRARPVGGVADRAHDRDDGERNEHEGDRGRDNDRPAGTSGPCGLRRPARAIHAPTVGTSSGIAAREQEVGREARA